MKSLGCFMLILALLSSFCIGRLPEADIAFLGKLGALVLGGSGLVLLAAGFTNSARQANLRPVRRE